MTSSGPGCPATVPKGALRRIGAFVARRIDKLITSACRLRIDSTIMESSWRRELLNEVLLVARDISFQSAAIS